MNTLFFLQKHSSSHKKANSYQSIHIAIDHCCITKTKQLYLYRTYYTFLTWSLTRIQRVNPLISTNSTDSSIIPILLSSLLLNTKSLYTFLLPQCITLLSFLPYTYTDHFHSPLHHNPSYSQVNFADHHIL